MDDFTLLYENLHAAFTFKENNVEGFLDVSLIKVHYSRSHRKKNILRENIALKHTIRDLLTSDVNIISIYIYMYNNYIYHMLSTVVSISSRLLRIYISFLFLKLLNDAKALSSENILTLHSRKTTGGNNQIRIQFQAPGVVGSGSLSLCHDLLGVSNRPEPPLLLLVTPVILMRAKKNGSSVLVLRI